MRDLVAEMNTLAAAPAEEEATAAPYAPLPDPLSQTFNLATRAFSARDESDTLTDEMNDLAGAEPDNSSAEQFFGGAVDRIAATVGFTPDQVVDLLRRGGENLEAVVDAPRMPMGTLSEAEMGLSDMEAGAAPDERMVTQALRDAAEAAGLPANVGDSFIAQVGGDTATGLMITALMIATRGKTGALGAVPAGAGKAERFARFFPRQLSRMGTTARARPGMAVAQEIGAATGAQALAHLGPLGALGGALLGARGGEGIAKLGSKAVRGADKGLTAMRQGLPKAPDPLVAPNVDPQSVVRSADAYVQREMGAIDNVINGVLDRNMPRVSSRTGHGAIVDSIETQERLVAELDRAQHTSQKMVSKVWADAVPKRHRIDMLPLQEQMAKLETELQRGFTGDDLDMPMRYISMIQGMKGTERAGKLLNLRSQLMDDIRMAKASGGTRLSKTTRANYQKIVEAIEDHVSTQLPDSVSMGSIKGPVSVQPSAKLAAAQAISKRHHDLFTRSALGDALATARSGGSRLDPTEVLDLLGKSRGIGHVIKDVDNFLKTNGAKYVPQVQARFEDAIRTTWRDAAKGMPEDQMLVEAEKFMRRVRPGIQKSLPVFGELKAATEELGRQMAVKAEMQRGVAAKFLRDPTTGAALDPQKAIQSMFTAGNPSEFGRQIMNMVKSDPDAVMGLRNLTLGEFFRRYGGSARRLQTELKGPGGKAVMAMLDPDQQVRLKKMIDVGARVENGDQKTIKWASGRIFVLASRFFGAGFGRYTSRLTGAGTVQQPGMLAEAFRNMSEGLLGEMPVNEMIAAAILGERTTWGRLWENVLYSKVPIDDKATRKLLAHMRRGFALINVGQLEVQKRLTGESE